jgi:hypothetical protein
MGRDDIKPGSIWTTGIPSRPDVEIIRVNIYSEVVIWCYAGQSQTFDTNIDQFLKQFKPKTN